MSLRQEPMKHITLDFQSCFTEPPVPLFYEHSKKIAGIISPKEGDTINITCSITGKQEPVQANYKWIKGSTEIFSGTRLIITNLSQNDTGEYTCKVQTMLLPTGLESESHSTQRTLTVKVLCK